MGYTNSSLVKHKIMSPNRYHPRKYPITRITIHHMAWILATSQQCGNSFKNPSRQASSNYGIGYDGDIALYVNEEDGAWTSSDYDNDNRAVTIEVANSTGSPNWSVSNKSYKALINLVTDICKRNGKTKILWLGDKEKTLAYEPKDNEMIMTVHRWFSPTLCPGPYLYSLMPDIARRVNEKLQAVKTEPAKVTIKNVTTEDQIWDFLKSKGLNDCAVAGIMGNLRAESRLIPTNLQNSFENKLDFNDESYTKAVDSGAYDNFADDKAGYGLAQWTYPSRKANLLAFAKAQKKSIGDLVMQLEFLWNEMQNYTTMMTELKDAKTVRDASNSFLFRFERPANQGGKVQDDRTNFGLEYYKLFSTNAVKTAKESLKLYRVQVGAFREKANAEKRVQYLKELGTDAILKKSGSYYKVQAGAFSKHDNAEALLNRMKNAGYDDAYIIYE